MTDLFIDIETYSDISIKKAGLYKYVQSSAFEILLFSYAYADNDVHVVDLAQGEFIPQAVITDLLNKNIIKHAHNASFEWYCLSKYLGTVLPSEQWHCTMLHALYCGYPASLDAVGRALNIDEDKQKLATGKALIRTFCIPCKPTNRNGMRIRTLPKNEPEKWKLFKEYNIQDVVTEREIYHRLSVFSIPKTVQDEWCEDLEMNSRGVAVDMDLVQGALSCSSQIKNELTQSASVQTGLNNPNSVQQLLEWLNDNEEYEIGNLRKETVTDLLTHGNLSEQAKAILEIRQELSKTSNKKYEAIRQAECSDGRVRGLLQFYGASRTGRWAGRLVQVQNLPRTYIDDKVISFARKEIKQGNTNAIKLTFGSVTDTLSQLIRTAFIPTSGCVFVDADFSAIEARVIAWLAGEEWVLDVFRTHGKIYEATASQMFNVPIEKIAKGNPEYSLRQKGKVATLALGYQGGTGALIQMGALRMGLDENELPDIVARWRATNKNIKALWYGVESAAIDTVQTGRTNTVGKISFNLKGDSNLRSYLTIKLPSGRELFYVAPKIVQGDRGLKLSTLGADSNKKFAYIDTYGGKLVENITQAVARDCLANAMHNLKKAGYNIVFHVHDEVIIEVLKYSADLDKVIKIMSVPPSWADGLPLNADGWIGEYYKKE